MYKHAAIYGYVDKQFRIYFLFFSYISIISPPPETNSAGHVNPSAVSQPLGRNQIGISAPLSPPSHEQSIIPSQSSRGLARLSVTAGLK